MRRLVLLLPVSALVGALFAVVGVLVARWWSLRDVPDGAGVYSFGPPEPYVDYLPSSDSDWTRLLLPAGVAGALLALALVGVGLVLHRRRRSV